MNRETLLKLLVPLLAFLGAIGGWLASKGAINAADAESVNVVGKMLIEPVAGIIAALILGFIGKIFHKQLSTDDATDGMGATKSSNGSGGNALLVLAMGTTAALLAVSLSSCSTPFADVTGLLSYRDAATGAKAAIVIKPKARVVTPTK